MFSGMNSYYWGVLLLIGGSDQANDSIKTRLRWRTRMLLILGLRIRLWIRL